jgi:hypothetical protein
MNRELSEEEKGFHRQCAVECFNNTWGYLDKNERTAQDSLAMIHLAHTSRYHWGVVGGAVNWARGEWQIARVYAILGRGEAALVHAQESLRLCKAHSIGDFDLAFAHEALARAHAVLGNKALREACLEQARTASKTIVDEEDRALLLSDLETIPR